mgnify:FL=1
MGIYLDNAATSYPKPNQVAKSIYEFMINNGTSSGRGSYKMAMKSDFLVYETRKLIGELFNFKNPKNVIFTSNITESINLALRGILKEHDHVVTSSLEHNAVWRCLKTLEKERNIDITKVRADEYGYTNPIDVRYSIKENTKLIVFTHASNVLGTIQPIKEIGEIAKKNNILFLVDTAQTAGVLDINIKENNIDYCTDETNLEDHYTRNRLRNHVIPYLEREINPRAVSHMADTMEQMRTVWAFMEEEVEKCRKYCVKPKQDKADGVVILEGGFRSVNETVRTFLIHELLCETAGRKKDIEQIHVKLVEELMEHQTGRKIMLPYEMTGERCYEGIWLHKVKDKEKSGENSKPPVQMRILERTPQTSVFPKKTYTKWFDYDIIKSTVKIRHKQPGDYITIDKNGSTQSLKKYFVNVKVPREDREKIWLAADGSHILWIIGYRQNQVYQVTDKTRRILEIEFNGGEEDGRESKSISS